MKNIYRKEPAVYSLHKMSREFYLELISLYLVPELMMIFARGRTKYNRGRIKDRVGYWVRELTKDCTHKLVTDKLWQNEGQVFDILSFYARIVDPTFAESTSWFYLDEQNDDATTYNICRAGILGREKIAELLDKYYVYMLDKTIGAIAPVTACELLMSFDVKERCLSTLPLQLGYYPIRVRKIIEICPGDKSGERKKLFETFSRLVDRMGAKYSRLFKPEPDALSKLLETLLSFFPTALVGIIVAYDHCFEELTIDRLLTWPEFKVYDS